MFAVIAAKIFSNRYDHMETTLSSSYCCRKIDFSSISTIVAITSQLSEASLIFFSAD